MKIELTPKEAFAISRSLGRRNRRKRYGTVGLNEKIFKQIAKEISAEEIKKLADEWSSVAEAPTPPKPKKVKRKDKGETKLTPPLRSKIVPIKDLKPITKEEEGFIE